MTTTIHGVCPHDCPDACAFHTEVAGGRALSVTAVAEHPVTQGWLCGKVRPYLEHVYHPDRLKYPLRRSGPKGEGHWQRVSWSEALDEIGQRWRAIGEQYGYEAILPYSYSGTLGLVNLIVSNARFWNRLGASQLLRSICDAAGTMAVEMTLGIRHGVAYADLAYSRLIIIWGHNPASTAPHLMPFLKKAQRNGSRVIVIDPRRTRTAVMADWHLALKPGTDGALALGLAHILEREGLHEPGWLDKYCEGWPGFRERIASFSPERVAQITGLEEDEIITLARMYGQTRPSLIKIADGVQRNLTGGQAVRAICALPALTGQYGQRGGGLAYSTSGILQWDSAAVGHADECPPSTRTINMNRLGAALTGEVTDPPVMSLFVFGSNPAAIAPNAGKVIRGLKRPDLFTVVHELFMTDTADYADIILPATSQLEQTDLHKAYGHTTISYNHQAIPPLGEAKSNWDVMRLLASTMDFDEPWLQQSPDEVIDEVLQATAAVNPALTGISLERLKREGSISLQLSSDIPFADGRFPTPSGKIELYSQQMADQGLDPLPNWHEVKLDPYAGQNRTAFELPRDESLILISSAAHHFVTSTFANQPKFLVREGSPFVEINPTDAAKHDIEDGQQVIVENARGWCRLRAVLTDAVQPGVLASPKGRWSKHNGGRNINWTTPDTLGDMAGQSTFHSNRVWIRPVAESPDTVNEEHFGLPA